jgi:hypothetical protein
MHLELELGMLGVAKKLVKNVISTMQAKKIQKNVLSYRLPKQQMTLFWISRNFRGLTMHNIRITYFYLPTYNSNLQKN